MIQNASQLKKYVMPWLVQSRRLNFSVRIPITGKMKYIPAPTAIPAKNARAGWTDVKRNATVAPTIAWAAVRPIVAFLLLSVHPALAFFAGIAVGAGMYFIFPVIGIRTEKFKRRDWTSHGITYFFSWLAFWIILLNPPFGDFVDPTIQAISVSPYRAGYNGSLACIAPVGGAVNLPLGPLNTSVYVLFRASDNVRLASVSVDVAPSTGGNFTLVPHTVTGFNQCAGHRSELYLGGTYNVTFVSSASSYAVTITAVDTSGRQASVA